MGEGGNCGGRSIAREIVKCRSMVRPRNPDANSSRPARNRWLGISTSPSFFLLPVSDGGGEGGYSDLFGFSDDADFDD